MKLVKLLNEFENAKAEIGKHLGNNHYVPIYVLNKTGNHGVEGDGFFYSGDGKFHFKHAGVGYSSDASPEELLKAYHCFGKEVGMEKALKKATRSLKNSCRDIELNF